ncbi:MAG TPA: hypothetical protein VMH35_05145 [Streptosporangiaceae bacterium]|nr:hypothetical protein [Streptosporangiaceae bacterium]
MRSPNWPPRQPGPGPGEPGLRAGAAAEPAHRAELGGYGGDPGQDAVILSVHDIRVVQEAITLARADGEPGGPAPNGAPGGGAPGDEAPGGGAPGGGAPGDEAPGDEAPGDEAPPGIAGRGAEPRLGARGPGGPPSRASSASSTPSWGTVLATTVRLWWQRRVRSRAAGPRWRVMSVLLLAAVLLAAAALAVTLTQGHGGSSAPGPGQPGSRGSAALRAAAAARTAAAGWLARQLAPDAIVACDPQMCAAAQQAGIPAGRLLVLRAPTAGPVGSDVLVATAAVRQEFGARLGRVYAPDVLASFGTGSARVAIRVVAPDGAAAYTASLRSDLAARVSASRQLLRNPQLHATAAARRMLAAGQVDARLLTVFAALATQHSVRLLGFAPAPAGASPGLPLRSADIAPAGPGTRAQPNSIQSLASFLQAQLAPYRPASVTEFRLPGGSPALHVDYAAPSPLGLLGKS